VADVSDAEKSKAWEEVYETMDAFAQRDAATKKGRCRLHGRPQTVAAALLASGMGNTATASGPRPRLRSGRSSAGCWKCSAPAWP